MSAPILFVLHGMGAYKPGWEKEVTAALETARQDYPYLADVPLDAWFRIAPISYDEEFEALRQLWRENAGKVVTFMQQAGAGGEFRQLLTELEASRLLEIQASVGKDSFFNTHILDVLLYRFTSVGEKVRIRVAKAIVNTLMAESGTVPSWSVLAHSLGTAVTHDTLHALYADKTWQQGQVSKLFVPGQYKADNIIMLANVSRVLESRIKAYESRVKPGNGGICHHFINAFHTLDPIARVKQFQPGDEWLAGQNNIGLFEQIALEVITQPNVHAYTHYLADPRVHVPVFRALCGEDAISAQEFNTAYDKFFATSPNASYQALRNALKAVNTAEPKDLCAVLAAWKQFSVIIDQFKGNVADVG